MDIRDYLPFYLGCDILATKDNAILAELGVKKGDTRKLTAPILFDAMYSANAYKLLLRPLSDIRDIELRSESMERIKAEICVFDLSLCKFTPAQFQYLLSRQFDLFGLIEAGLALDLTKLEPSTISSPLQHSEL